MAPKAKPPTRRSDAGDAKRAAPQRTCIATGEEGPTEGYVRFVRGPDDAVVVDAAEKLPGRGAWVKSDRSAVETAVKRNAFSRSFKAQTPAQAGLADAAEAALERRVLDAIGLARRAGDVVMGFDQVRALLKSEAPGALLFASDAAADGRGKLLRLARAAHGETPLLACFDSGVLGLALGREGAIYAAVKSGGCARRLLRDAARLAGFRALVPAEWAVEPDGAAPQAGSDRSAADAER